jgi:DNA-binding HxlR family transcriptional regulator
VIEDEEAETRFAAEAKKAALFQLLGSAHSLAILRKFAADPGSHRFTDLQDDLDISPTTLSDRLEELCDAGILRRKSYDEVPPRVEYHPTEKGEALRPMLEAVGRWVEDYGD